MIIYIEEVVHRPLGIGEHKISKELLPVNSNILLNSLVYYYIYVY